MLDSERQQKQRQIEKRKKEFRDNRKNEIGKKKREKGRKTKTKRETKYICTLRKCWLQNYLQIMDGNYRSKFFPVSTFCTRKLSALSLSSSSFIYNHNFNPRELKLIGADMVARTKLARSKRVLTKLVRKVKICKISSTNAKKREFFLLLFYIRPSDFCSLF